MNDLQEPADHAAQVSDLRRLHAVGDPPCGGDRHLRHPRRRREAQAAAFRRPSVPRRVDLALSARRISRALRHVRRARHALRQEADRAENPDHHCRHELRLAVGSGQGGAGPRRDDRRHLDHHRRRRHDRGGARPFEDAGLSVSAVALRHEPQGSQARRRDRDRRRPGREARRRRHAARPEDLRPRRPYAQPAARASTSARPAAIPTGPGPTTSRSRSSKSARSPTGRSRST